MRARPVRTRRVAFGIATVVVVLFVLIAALLGRTSSEGVEFGPGDQVAMVLIGVLVAGAVLLLARPAVVADLEGARVRNIFTTKDVPEVEARILAVAAASTAERCCGRSPGLSRLSRILAIRNGRPVRSESVRAVRRIWPPPSPREPSSSTGRPGFDMV